MRANQFPRCCGIINVSGFDDDYLTSERIEGKLDKIIKRYSKQPALPNQWGWMVGGSPGRLCLLAAIANFQDKVVRPILKKKGFNPIFENKRNPNSGNKISLYIKYL